MKSKQKLVAGDKLLETWVDDISHKPLLTQNPVGALHNMQNIIQDSYGGRCFKIYLFIWEVQL